MTKRARRSVVLMFTLAGYVVGWLWRGVVDRREAFR